MRTIVNFAVLLALVWGLAYSLTRMNETFIYISQLPSHALQSCDYTFFDGDSCEIAYAQHMHDLTVYFTSIRLAIALFAGILAWCAANLIILLDYAIGAIHAAHYAHNNARIVQAQLAERKARLASTH